MNGNGSSRRSILRSLGVAAGSFALAGVLGGRSPRTGHARQRQDGNDPLANVTVPDGFRIDTYAAELQGALVEPHGGANPGPRFMAFHDGTPFVAVPGEANGDSDAAGAILALPDANGDGVADRVVSVLDGLNRPNSLAFHDGWLYVGETHTVARYRLDGLGVVPDSREVVVDMGTRNENAAWSTTIHVHDGWLWISKGTAVKAGRENRFREAITRCGLDGSDCVTWATGLRNAVDFTFASDGTLVATEMGMGHEDPDFPPDEIDVIERGGDYGWPHCHADNRPIDPDFVENPGSNHHDDLLRESDVDCSEKRPPTIPLRAHVAPLGLTFYTDSAFPERYRGDLFVAYHGSWGIQPPRGYKIVRIDWDGTREIRDFATGWLGPEGTIHGRPVDLVVGPDGDLFVSDDTSGRIYRIWYEG